MKDTLIQGSAETILTKLKDSLDIPNVVKIKYEPYETLIITIVSQNTSDTNTERAFRNLTERYNITPHTFVNASLKELEECLHVGGLHKSKAQTIQNVSRIIVNKYQGSLNKILSLPLDAARKTLMEMPGVGPKTADVVLLFSAKKPTIPVDTHVNRVSKRLGLASPNGDYETVRMSLQSIFNPKDYLLVHLLLIAHGRKYCKARLPYCSECPIQSNCLSNTSGEKT